MSNMDALSVSARLEADKSLAALFDILRDYGETPAALWLKGEEELSLSYAEMTRRADDYASLLSSLASDHGWIAIAVDTCHDWPTLFWGVIRSGHNALLLDASAADSMIQSLLDEAGCKVIISRKPRGLTGDVRQIDFKTVVNAPRTIGFTPVWGNYVAMCTSGTTGRSRIFAYSGEAVCEQALASVQVYHANQRVIHSDNRGRKLLAFLPFHHVLGFMANVIWGCFLGAANVYLPDRTPNSIINVCRHFPPNLLVVVPLVGNSLVKSMNKTLKKETPVKRSLFKAMNGLSLAMQAVAPKAGLRLAEKRLFASVNNKLLGTEVEAIILGGSHTPVETLRSLNALGYYTINGYGMTETAVTGFETSMRLRKRLNGSVGCSLGAAEYRIANPGENGNGELQIRGAGIHSGRVVHGEVLPPDVLDGGWFPTGDVAGMDASGRVYIRGRLKDVIINESGENVYPDDLEDAFSALSGAEQICVVGFRRNKRDNNEDVVLVMNVGENYSDNAYLNALAGKVAAVNARLPLYSQLDRALVTPMTLPLVSGIKVKRIELKRMYDEGELIYRELDLRSQSAGAEIAAVQKAPGKTAVRDEIRRKVRAMYAEALDIPEKDITDSAHFIEDLQGDSLQVLSIALKAEEEWGITIPAEEYGQCATVEGMARVVETLLNGPVPGEKPAERVPVRPITRFEDTPEYLHFLERQKALIGNGDNPYFVAHESPLLDTGIVDGKEILEFGSYNYVGMSGRKEVKEAAKAAIDKYGTSASGSRLLAGEKMIHKELEKEIADWKHTEDAIVCVGGHSTNVTFVGNFCGKKDLILYDALAHNSIEQGCKLSDATSRPFPHSDVAALESILKNQRAYYEKVLIVIEGAYSMDGDIAPVPDFVRVKKEYGCFLMVDEAHSACVIGQTGGGVDEYFNLDGNDIDIKYGTLSKGLGTCGGYLAGKKCMIDYLRYNMPGFVFSVGISPALAAGSLAAIRTLRSHPEIMEHLRTAIKAFSDSARRRHLDICLAGETAVLPVLVGKDEDAWFLSNELKKRGVSVPPAMYPAVPKGKARLRFCVISEHKPEQIERALDILEATAKEFGIELPRRNYD
ncbi:MAG: aminotransferase class I/II-fold pyridoxal phosphate-dependent enzyme [Clostridiales bacterium]|nr:aminotransferase class I/II-fold pyridoxal phosphate-dependent enzyme [Clostridiales bacterium]